ncbi:MAG: hypothetical protein IJ736_11845 [Firmicutes bacterium]|nr:hypothetical protein [Bacillota bacterium]
MVSILSLFMLTSCIYQHKTNISESKNIKNTSEETTEIISKIEENTPETEAESVNYEITNIVFTPINDSIGNRYYCGIVEILNTGTKPIYLQDCVFDLEDNNKHLLKSDYVVYYDENKIPIDIEITYAGNTIAGASSSFECSSSLSPLFRHLGTDKIADYKVFAESIYFQF